MTSDESLPEPNPNSNIEDAPEVPDTKPPTIHPKDRPSIPIPHFQYADLSGFEIVRELGRGSMGVVFEAVRKKTGERAALKVIAPLGETTEKSRQLFLREAEVLKRLNHPRIVRFLESGIDNNRPFLAMEFVTSIPIDIAFRLSPAGKVSAACSLTRQALEGLAHAHSQGFVHRDVKPTNILITRDGDRLAAKLADFGVAKSYQKANYGDDQVDRDYTDPREIRGTLAFMPPEQALDSLNAQPSVDIYGIAATLYYWLCDRFPYDFKSSFDIALRQILQDEPISLLTRMPQLPTELASLIHRALARRPEERPTASEFRLQLKPFTQWRENP